MRPPAAPGGFQHAAVDVIGNAGEHVLRRLAHALGPVLAHQLMVAAKAAGRDDDGLGLEQEIPEHLARAFLAALDVTRLQNLALHAIDPAAGLAERSDAMAEAERDQPAFLGLAHAPHERRDQAGPGAPGDVEARHRIAVAGGEIAAALGPADDREPAHAHGVQPRPLFAGGEIDIGLGPLARPVVLVAVEAGGAEPVLQGKLARVADAKPALLGRVHQHQPAERPKRLASEGGFRFLVEQDHLLAGVGELGGGGQTRETGADDDYVRVHGRILTYRNWNCPGAGERSVFSLSPCGRGWS